MREPVARGPRITPASKFGARLARERKRQCKSLATLARIAEMHVSQISLLERGLLDIRLSTIVRLARALDVSLYDLLDEIDRPPDAAP
jgi:transcriptional regulator with XRE-family HTH domain